MKKINPWIRWPLLAVFSPVWVPLLLVFGTAYLFISVIEGEWL